MIEAFTPTAVMTLGNIAVNAKSEKVRIAAAAEIMHMSMGKPVQKSVNINRNLNSMDEGELDALLTGYLKELTGDQKKLIENVVEVEKVE